jgi:glycyl-tRNA synthetase
MTTAKNAPTMQEAILRLQAFWAERGALIAQPFNTEVGAGTANPATALRVLGPEPWRVAYVEPSVRPDDSRYGENPNRLQTHTQYQVILKPTPDDPQEVYLESLAVLGIDIRAHDIRFVEDNWASPALGAWGLGWEVWLDGLEITQFTYFQQAGGITLEPVSVELTYGLERIMMSLQGVRHFTEIRYADQLSYGEVFLQPEFEMSRYYLDAADIETNRELFRLYAAEAQRMLDLSLPVPAYTYVLKCSHTFNVLDSRGAVSTTERARSFTIMRRLTRAVSELWIARRAELGYPLGVWQPPELAVAPEPPTVTGTHRLLVEIGVEELPHLDVREAATAVRSAVEDTLAATRLTHGEVAVKSTPRRIVATVADVAEAEHEATRVIRGPRVSAAYGEDGQPTRALLGFLRGQAAGIDDVTTVTEGSAQYVAIEKREPGQTAPQIVGTVVDKAVRSLHASRNMRWGDPQLSYSRPVRWLLVVLGQTVIPVAVSALVSGTTTRLMRGAEPAQVEVGAADGFEELLAAGDIVLDRDERRNRVTEGAAKLAAGVGGGVDADAEADLIDEITDLVESPNLILGSFQERYLELPSAVLTTVMRKHQRYLPVRRDGALLPYFITAANGPCNADLVRAGNESVLRARYEDAAFFWRADLKVPPMEFRRRLSTLLFEERLGSFDDRVNRIAALAETFADRLGLGQGDRAVIRRAGQLGKFDLASQMVVELSSLAGTMARDYALRAGEPPAVAQALAEMEMPRTNTSPLPESTAGAVLSLADRFDLLTSMFAIGAIPTGTSDPFGVRRTALGIVRLLRSFPALAEVSIPAGIRAAADRLAVEGVTVPDDAPTRAAEFVVQRYELQLLDAHHPVELVRAVMPSAGRPANADTLLHTLGTIVAGAAGRAIITAVQRTLRILPDDPVLLAVGPVAAEPADLELDRVVTGIEARLADVDDDQRLARFFEAAAGLPAAIDRFFDEVQVIHPDPDVRAARLTLLRRVADVAGTQIDWDAIR